MVEDASFWPPDPRRARIHLFTRALADWFRSGAEYPRWQPIVFDSRYMPRVFDEQQCSLSKSQRARLAVVAIALVPIERLEFLSFYVPIRALQVLPATEAEEVLSFLEKWYEPRTGK